MDFLHFFFFLRKSVEKMIYQKKNRSLNPGKATAMATCPIIVHFII